MDKVCVGVIAGAFGVRGEVRIKSFCTDPLAIFEYPLTNQGGHRDFNAVLVQPVKNGFSAQIQGVTTKEEADALNGTEIYADRVHLPDLDDDEYYYADLINMKVFDTGGEYLGKVKLVVNHGAGDMLEVFTESGKNTVSLPFTKACVPTVDIAGKRIIADPPEGLFD
jgi:16S rRNA processing protein RimM